MFSFTNARSQLQWLSLDPLSGFRGRFGPNLMTTGDEPSAALHTRDCSDTQRTCFWYKCDAKVSQQFTECSCGSCYYFSFTPVLPQVLPGYGQIDVKYPMLNVETFRTSIKGLDWGYILTFDLTTFILETRPYPVKWGPNSYSQVFYCFLQWFFSLQQQTPSPLISGDSNRAWQLLRLGERLFCFSEVISQYPCKSLRALVCGSFEWRRSERSDTRQPQKCWPVMRPIGVGENQLSWNDRTNMAAAPNNIRSTMQVI